MPDNVGIVTGAGATIATDEVSGSLEHVQLFKLAYSTDGSRVLVPADADGLMVNARTRELTGPDETLWLPNRQTVSRNIVSAAYSSVTTGLNLATPSNSSESWYVSYLQLQIAGTTAGEVTLWFAPTATISYVRGTHPTLFSGSFVPSSTNRPGVILEFKRPIRGGTNNVLKLTTNASVTLTLNIWGWQAP